jgi:hypothetical protein
MAEPGVALMQRDDAEFFGFDKRKPTADEARVERTLEGKPPQVRISMTPTVVQRKLHPEGTFTFICALVQWKESANGQQYMMVMFKRPDQPSNYPAVFCNLYLDSKREETLVKAQDLARRIGQAGGVTAEDFDPIDTFPGLAVRLKVRHIDGRRNGVPTGAKECVVDEFLTPEPV